MRFYLIISFFLFSSVAFTQETLSELLQQYNNKSVPYISVQELAMPKTKAIILDAREIEEYNVSHIKDAIHVGYDFFDINTVLEQITNKEETIVVYCSLGIRSETIAEKIKKAGYNNVLNLYGGIFEWKNNAFKVYDLNDLVTEKIHTFSQEWSKWLLKGEKVYDK